MYRAPCNIQTCTKHTFQKQSISEICGLITIYPLTICRFTFGPKVLKLCILPPAHLEVRSLQRWVRSPRRALVLVQRTSEGRSPRRWVISPRRALFSYSARPKDDRRGNQLYRRGDDDRCGDGLYHRGERTQICSSRSVHTATKNTLTGFCNQSNTLISTKIHHALNQTSRSSTN